MRHSPKLILSLEPNQVFVFGANEAGIHGAGAAKMALRWGAEYDHYGRMGRTYGIPTKDMFIHTLPPEAIKAHVITFLAHALAHPDDEFLVTEIGCGLAGLSPLVIAPMFRLAMDEPNIRLPKIFIDCLQANKPSSSPNSSSCPLKTDE